MAPWLDKVIDWLIPEPKRIVFTTYESIIKLGNQEKRILVVIDDTVYDLTDFNDHPGGYKVLELCKGKDASDIFRKYHWPEGNSRKMMKDYKIGELHLGLEPAKLVK